MYNSKNTQKYLYTYHKPNLIEYASHPLIYDKYKKNISQKCFLYLFVLFFNDANVKFLKSQCGEERTVKVF